MENFNSKYYKYTQSRVMHDSLLHIVVGWKDALLAGRCFIGLCSCTLNYFYTIMCYYSKLWLMTLCVLEFFTRERRVSLEQSALLTLSLCNLLLYFLHTSCSLCDGNNFTDANHVYLVLSSDVFVPDPSPIICFAPVFRVLQEPPFCWAYDKR